MAQAIRHSIFICRRSQQAKGRSKSRGDAATAAAEGAVIKTALLSLLQDAPKAILEAVFESLGYGSGELFEAAKETLAAFVRPPAGYGSYDDDSSPLEAALAADSDLASWLLATSQAFRGMPCFLAAKEHGEYLSGVVPGSMVAKISTL